MIMQGILCKQNFFNLIFFIMTKYALNNEIKKSSVKSLSLKPWSNGSYGVLKSKLELYSKVHLKFYFLFLKKNCAY